MKVLIVSHSCVVKENQKKVEALAKNKDAEITLLIPYKWRESLRNIKAEKVHDKNYSIIVSKVYFSGRISIYFYPLGLVVKLLRKR